MGVPPSRLLTAAPDPFARRVVVERPFAGERPQGRRHRHRPAGHRHRRLDRRLRAGAVRRCRGRASSAPPMPAGRAPSPACSKTPSRRWKASAPGANASSPCSAPRSASRNYEVGPEFVARFVEADAGQRRLFRALGKAGHAHVRPQPLYGRPAGPKAGVRAERPRPLHLCRGGSVLLLSAHHAPQGGGLRPADFGNRSGERLMALHFERAGIRRAARPADDRDGREEARRHAAVCPGKHVLADRLRHVRLLLLPVPGGQGRRLDGAAHPLGRSAPGAAHLDHRQHRASGPTATAPIRRSTCAICSTISTCSAPASASNTTPTA